MKYVTLTNTDLTVSRICLGTGSLGSVVPRPAAFAIMDAFVDAGGTFFDSAHYYANWIPGERHLSEKTIGAWLKARGGKGNLVIATKGGHPDAETPNVSRLAPRDIVGDLDASLDLLGLSTIDLYWLHRDDPRRPVGEIVETLNDQLRLGKIRFLGCSNWRPARIREAHAYASAHGLQSFVASQIFWSLAVPNPGTVKWDQAAMDDEAAEFYRTASMSVHAFTSQAKGFFAKADQSGGRVPEAGAPPGVRKRAHPRPPRAGPETGEPAGHHRVSHCASIDHVLPARRTSGHRLVIARVPSRFAYGRGPQFVVSSAPLLARRRIASPGLIDRGAREGTMSNSTLVYSSDGGRVDFCPTCGLRRDRCTCRRKPVARPTASVPNDGIVRLHRDRKGRGGKSVTLITGVRATPTVLDELATTLKRHCGCGGAVKDGVIEIQGDHRERLAPKLAELGYKVKIAGGVTTGT